MAMREQMDGYVVLMFGSLADDELVVGNER
jgi:hypothetical protein